MIYEPPLVHRLLICHVLIIFERQEIYTIRGFRSPPPPISNQSLANKIQAGASNIRVLKMQQNLGFPSARIYPRLANISVLFHQLFSYAKAVWLTRNITSYSIRAVIVSAD
jgi:hypothetical protein